MLQERLVWLPTLSAEHEIAQNTNLKVFASTFTKLKAHKVKF